MYNLRRVLVIAKERYGVEDFAFHGQRHTFAARLAQSGVDLIKSQNYLVIRISKLASVMLTIALKAYEMW